MMVSKAKRRGKAKRKVKIRNAGKRKKVVKTKRQKKKVVKRVKHEKMQFPLFAVIRIRGPVSVRNDIRDTMVMLRLGRVNHCVLVPSNPSYKGMLHKAEECITWGEINQQTLQKLIFKRGSVEGEDKEMGKTNAGELAKKIMSTGVKKVDINSVFRLNPPSKGYKSIRRFYPKGDLGYRGEKINELLKRMI
jgi:large subunit ribosomal protein L30